MAVLLLIDDHPLVHVALEAALPHSPVPLTLIAVATAAEAREVLSTRAVDLIILDVSLADSNGLEVLRRIKAHDEQQKVLIYSAQQDQHAIRTAMAAGAAGYIVKSQTMAQLLSAILAVLGGHLAFPPLAEPEEASSLLTAKEQQILSLLARGFSNLQIAGQLHISNKTVSTHKKNILDKTGARSVVELAEIWKAQQ